MKKPAAGTARKPLSERKVLRSFFMIVALIAVGCSALVIYSTYRDGQNKKAPERAANEFLNSLQVGGAADAYTQLCDATKQDYTEAQFADYVKKQPEIASHSIVSTDVRTVNGVTSAVVTVKIVETGGSHETHSVVLADQDDKWLVCGQPY